MREAHIRNGYMMRFICHLLAGWLLLLFTGSCVIDITPEDRDEVLSEKALVITPLIEGGELVTTKTAGVAEYGENDLISLDIFVYKYNGSTLDGSAPYQTYHLPKGAASGNLNGTGSADYQLEADWTTYYASGKYRIYAVANNDNTHDASGNVPNLSETELWNLKTDSPMTYTGSNHTPAYDIVRLKTGQVPGEQGVDIESKVFQMDGMIDNWEPTPGQTKQYFTLKGESGENPLTFDLKRAAAKIDLSVSYSDSFLGRVNNWTAIEWYDRQHEHPKTEEMITNIGLAQFKFVNFGTRAYDITYALGRLNQDPPLYSLAELWTSDQRFDFPIHTAPDSGPDKNPYQLITYSYPFRWETDEEAVDYAPAILVSVGYTIKLRSKNESGEPGEEKEAGTTINYYRIPLVDDSKRNSIERNTLYRIIAEIDSKGSSSLDDPPTPVNLKYQVIPWITNTSTDITNVEAKELYYFTAEQDYTLRGNSRETAYLRYWVPTGYTPTISDVKVYYKKDPSTSVDITSSQYGGNNTGVTINVNSTAGRFEIASDYLHNRAVKYIEFKASVTFDLGTSGTKTVTLNFKVKHFPLDNIQSVLGAWSSRNNGEMEDNIVPDESTATSGVSLTNNDISNIFGVANNNQRNANAYATGATSISTAKYYNGYFYWVTRTNSGGSYTYTYHRASATVIGQRPATYVDGRYTWVDWDKHTGNRWYDNNFNAKYWGSYYGGYACTYSMSSNSNGSPTNQSSGNYLRNNHMYIIQISKAENSVHLGRPILDNKYQSSDNVVSPAFMIASQLGAVSSFRNNDDPAGDAAVHCHSYMEVAQNGRRFVGWRLPTTAEIKYIVGYQRNTTEISGKGVFEDVLTGGHYYTLDGSAADTNYTTDTNYAVRCIRDLTPAEVKELNETGTITTASY